MRHPERLLALACVSCNGVFGLEPTLLVDAAIVEIDAPAVVPPDRDRDGIPDHEDSCIASIADGKGDFEGDSFLNESDGCPFDNELTDGDGDTIYDDCDQFVALAGDRRRCLMAFQNPTITRELFAPRAGDTATWGILELSGLTASGTGTFVAAESFDGPATTMFDLRIYASAPLAPATTTSVALWLRTNAVAGPADVGCEISGNTTSSELRLRSSAGMATMPVTRPIQGGWKLQATIEPGITGRANVRCVADVWYGPPAPVSVSAQIVLPPGTVGFGVAENTARFSGLTVLERDDAPSL